MIQEEGEASGKDEMYVHSYKNELGAEGEWGHAILLVLVHGVGDILGIGACPVVYGAG